MHNVYTLNHPLVQHHLARLRDRNTGAEEFRALLRRLTTLLAYEATQDLAVREVAVETPMAPARGRRLVGRIGLIPILRAGLGMVEPILDLIPQAEVWHLGFYRDERTLRPIEYYCRLPSTNPVDVALVVDPMLATGGSAEAALSAVRAWGVRSVKLLAILAAPEGIQRVHQNFPETQIYVCAIDERLNDHGFILPGLGDAGDRMFNARVSS